MGTVFGRGFDDFREAGDAAVNDVDAGGKTGFRTFCTSLLRPCPFPSPRLGEGCWLSAESVE
jgi:hypothetical protein